MKKTLKACLFILLVLLYNSNLTLKLSAQSTSDVDPDIAGNLKNISAVKLDGKELFFVRGISSYPSDQRAATIAMRIKKAAENRKISADSVIKVIDREAIQIFAGADFIMNVYPIDAEQEGVSQELLSNIIVLKIHDAIVNFRMERSKQVLVRKGIYAFVASILLVIVLYLFIFLKKRIGSWLNKHIKSSVDSVESGSFRLIRSGQMLKTIMVIARTLNIILIAFIIIVFLEYVLSLFPWTGNIASTTIRLIINPIKSIGIALLNYLPSLFFLIIIFIITRYLLKLVKLFFNGIESGGIHLKSFYAEWSMPTYRIIRIFIIAFAVIVAFPYIPGSGSSAFKGVSVFVGVLFSLGSSSFIGNLIAGYSMTYRRAFMKGDLIEVDNQKGFVMEQKILVTRLRSFKNEDIVIPNSIMLNSKIINYSSKPDEKWLIIHANVGIGYETPWRQVDAMLKLAASRTEGLLKDPPPFVLKTSLGDFAVNYEINVYCDDVVNINRHYTLLHQNILDVFNENNVQIMTPAYEHDPETPKVVPKDQWDTPLINEVQQTTGNK